MLLTQTPLQHLLKMPILFEHYTEHQAWNSSISFAEFIKHHYFSGDDKYADYERDQQLPFRADVILLMNSTDVTPFFVALDDIPLVYQNISYPLLDIPNFSSLHRFDIWQPPRA